MNHREMILSAVRAAGDHGATLDDLIHATGIQKVSVSPQLRPLERQGHIVRDGKRYGHGRNLQTVWKAVPPRQGSLL